MISVTVRVFMVLHPKGLNRSLLLLIHPSVCLSFCLMTISSELNFYKVCITIASHHELPALTTWYLGSAPHVFFFHVVLSTDMLSLTPFSSYHPPHDLSIFPLASLFLSIHPTFMFITLLFTCVASLLFTCPNQDKRFPFSFSVIVATFYTITRFGTIASLITNKVKVINIIDTSP